MKKVIILLMLTLFCISAYSQSVVIKGHVLASDDELAGYNVILLQKSDSIFYKGDFYFFVDREFEVNVELNRLPLLLKITSLGYKDTLIHVDRNKLFFPNIYLSVDSSKILQEVVIRGNVPLYTAKKDRITMNVSNTILNQAGTAIDVLQKAARVKIDNNGISVLGVGNAILIVDGKVLPSNQILESISSSDIEKIDIITNPSAKYDASGKAVIEITRKKAKNEGWGGEINLRLGKGKEWREYIGTELSARLSKLSLFGSYSFAPSKQENKETYKYDYPDINSLIVNERQTKLNHKKNHSVRFSADYLFSPVHAIGAQFNSQIRDTHKDIYNSNDINKSNDLTTSISLHDGNLDRKYISGTAYYSYTPVSKKSTLNVLYDKSLFNTKEITNVNENQTLKNNNVKTDINIDALKVDWVINLLILMYCED